MKPADVIQYLNKRVRNSHLIILVGLIVFMTSVTGICNRINAGELLVYICFQILCLILPGAAVMALLPIKNLRKIESITLVYASGYMLTILLYAALMLTVGIRYVRGVFLLLPILACAVLAFKKNAKMDCTLKTEEKSFEREENVIWIGTVLAVFFVMLVVFSMRWKIPYTAGSNNYETDFLYWTGDMVALKKHFPPKEFRTLAPGYRYHYFGALQQTAVSVVTGIQAVKVAVCYSFIESALLTGLSSYALVSRMMKNKAAQVLALLLLLFSTGYEEVVPMTYIWHMYLVPMSYDIAQALGLIVVTLLLVQLENEKTDVRNLVWSLCCLLCCTGTKSAAGAVVLCGFAAAYLYLFLSRSSRRTACIATGVMLVVFGAVGVYLWPIAKNYNLTLHLPDIQLNGGSQAMQSLRSCAAWIVRYGVKTARSNCFTFIPAGIYCLYLLFSKKLKKGHLLFVVIILAGTMAAYVINFNGNSQMYFCFIAFPFAAVLTGCLAEIIFEKYLRGKAGYAAAGAISAAAIVFMLQNNYLGYFGSNLAAGVKNIGSPNAVDRHKGECLLYVSQAQCEAYTWIRDNTEEDVILLSDRVWGNLHDPTGVFSERYAYLFHDHDIDYLRGISCFAGDQEAVRYYAELGLDYIVQRKFYTPLFTCPEDVGEVAFENEEVAVYRLYFGQRGKRGVFY